MSSATMSSPNFQSILDAALDSYSKQTGIDLIKHPSADKLQDCRSPDDVLRILSERESAFKDYRDQYRALVDRLRPVVQVIHAFSRVLGEAAGVVPFQPTKAVFVGVDVLLSAAAGVSASYDALADLFECVANFLRRFQIYAEKISLSQTMSDIMVKIMVEVLSVLALATKQIKQGRFKKFAKRLLGESDVEAVLRRLDRLTQEEARVTVAHTLEVVHRLFDNLRVVMDEGKVSTDGIQKALVMVQETANRINKMERNQVQKDVRGWLSPPDPSTNHNIARRDLLYGTTSWFTQGSTFKNWKETGSLLWIHGKPGSGKSILCSGIIQELKDIHDTGLAHMTYFYCDFRDAKKQQVTGLLTSLIAQLSAKSDACCNILSALFSVFDAGSRQPSDDELMNCLEDMLNLEGEPPIYIIIDALDECPNDSGVVSPRERVLEQVEKLLALHLPNVRICITSRPEADIQAVLIPLASHIVSLHDEQGQKKDIVDYVKSIVYSDRKMRRWREEDKEMVVETLSQKADGMFRWTVCQLEALRRCFPSGIRQALDELPMSLDETYDRILLGITRERQGYAQRLLQCLSESIRPLRAEELAEILAIRFHTGALPKYDVNWRPENPEEAVLSACSSLITIVDMDTSRVVQFSHFSVKEYLSSERLASAGKHLSQYHILSHSAHTILAQASLSVLLALDDQVDKEKMKNFPFAIYAARYWVDHAQFDDVCSNIKVAMEQLFDPIKPHFSAWVWIYDIDYRFREIMFEAGPTPPKAVPLYYATLCGFRDLVEHIIVTYPGDINARGGHHATPLHTAVVKGDVDVMKLLLEHGADVAAVDRDGFTPLREASRRGRLDIVLVLLDHHAGINFQGKDGRTALSGASFEGELEVARVLLLHGAAPDTGDAKGFTPLILASQNGHLDIVLLLLENGAAVDLQNNDGWTPLMSASRYGHLDVVILLLQNGASVDPRIDDGWTPLMLASGEGHLDVIHLLLQHGAAVELRNNDGWTPLMSASRCGHLDVVLLLLQNAAIVDSRDNNGWTPLAIASEKGYLDIVQLLLQGGATVDSRPNDGWFPSSDLVLEYQDFSTPLHLASVNGHLVVAEVLIQYGTDVNTPNQNLETPLHLASGHGHLNIVRLLLTYGSSVNSQDCEDSTPLHRASQNGHLDIVALLLRSGAGVDIQNSNCMTPLDLALCDGRFDVARCLAEWIGGVVLQHWTGLTPLDTKSQDSLPGVANPLLGHASDPNIPDEQRTSLHAASFAGHLEIVRSLLGVGADVDERDEDHRTPLYFASLGGRVEVAKLLIEYGANVNLPDRTGWTPLHAASRDGHADVVHLLLDHGADVNATKQDHWTALHLAILDRSFEVVKALLERGAIVSVQNDDGKTPFQIASRGGERDIMRLLAEYGADGK